MMPTNDELITVSKDPIESVNHLSVKLPPCWMQDIELWLLQCEAQFCMHNIQHESTKFDYIIQALPPEVIMQLQSFILDLPTNQPYSKLKDELQRLHMLSNKQCYRQIMWEESLGDEKPSQFLQRMLHLVGGDQVESAFLKEMFLEKIPSAYHPTRAACRAFSQLKVSIMARSQSQHWVECLPLVLLGICSTIKEDLRCCPAKLVFGIMLRLPGELVVEAIRHN